MKLLGIANGGWKSAVYAEALRLGLLRRRRQDMV